MPMTRYVALLRGINVGGGNLIKMSDLKACFEAMGLAEVQTYIQSGNVLFSSNAAGKPALVERIESALSEAFGYTARVLVFSAAELRLVVAQAPTGFGERPDEYRYDVLFVKAPLLASEAFVQIRTKPGVDEASAGKHAIYYRRLIRKATQSYLSRFAGLPVYKSVTARNWNTTTRLLEMAKR